MMEDDDDFTFPTVAAEAPPPAPGGRLGIGRRDDGDPVLAARPLQLPLPDDLTAASPLWPFAGSPSPKATPLSSASSPVDADGDARVSGSNGREGEQRAAEATEVGERGVAADEERMDQLWEGVTTTAPAPQQPAVSGAGHAEPPPPNPKQQRRGEPEDDKQRAAAVSDADRMDKLWESFNEELLLLRRARSKSAAADRAPGSRLDPADHWYLCNYSPSDAGSEETSASSPAGYGCAPTMLRASSRAGGAGQFCGSPRGRRRGGRGAAAGWALLLRLFRRLFAVEKAPASSRSHASLYVP